MRPCIPEQALRVLMLVVLPLTVACGCRRKSSQANSSWQHRCEILEKSLEHERAQKHEALRMQARWRKITGWSASGAVACLVFGAILGSRTRRLAEETTPDKEDERAGEGDSGADDERSVEV
jgi:hypothetical protein